MSFEMEKPLNDLVLGGKFPYARKGQDGKWEIVDQKALLRVWSMMKAVEAGVKAMKPLVREVLNDDTSNYMELRNSGSTRKIRDYEMAEGIVPPEIFQELLKLTRNKWTPADLQRVIKKVTPGLSVDGAKQKSEEILGDLLQLEPKAPSIQRRKEDLDGK
jgi:hypothetical protein